MYVHIILQPKSPISDAPIWDLANQLKLPTNVTGFVKRGLPHTSSFLTLKEL